ncbi:N-acetylmuramic acid 6-phosphate etherase [Sphingomonas sp. AR_OL41]|uniref:N-acetylmuramic acid 6-phosphate etherase n=1 Tax=Sphingomonas sp. AR_OL41 TaxID=3042729 RepID=UPI0024815D27|nr:N-acetylmuramic acid 6-phosphate etherase [Sphingomonas sp. AR_OL41]MDH7971254.1 N-acetylmuramic acid 6-phosphate etherase [Sphingomonas sp. AR_OL41]
MSTETVDPRFVDLDRWPSEHAVEAMLEGQLAAVAAIHGQVRAIADAADAAGDRLRHGGRLVYVGAGTSGRIAVQDGVELFPTYNWPQERLVFLMAGGLDALTKSAERAEDDADGARARIAATAVGAEDVVIGVAASGRTPFTIAAIDAARSVGALTIGISNNADTPLLSAAEHAIAIVTGSEIVAGSTRMKAGTAQKAVLNMLSTTTMLRCGLVYRGMMVNMRVSNDKLLQRGQAMIRDIAGVSDEDAGAALERAGLEIKPGVLIAMGAHRDQAEHLLRDAHGDLHVAVAALLGRQAAHA